MLPQEFWPVALAMVDHHIYAWDCARALTFWAVFRRAGVQCCTGFFSRPQKCVWATRLGVSSGALQSKSNGGRCALAVSRKRLSLGEWLHVPSCHCFAGAARLLQTFKS